MRNTKVLNISYFVVLIFTYIIFIHNRLLENLHNGYGLLTSFSDAIVQYSFGQYMLVQFILIVMTTAVVLENIEKAQEGKTKYKGSKDMKETRKKNKRVHEVEKIKTQVLVKERDKFVRIDLDEDDNCDDVVITYNVVLAYIDVANNETIEIEFDNKEIYDSVIEGASYLANITIEYDRKGNVINTQIAFSSK